MQNKEDSIEEINFRLCNLDDAMRLALLGQATFLETFAGILDGANILAHCFSKHDQSVYRAWLEETSFKIWIAEASPNSAPVGYLVLSPPELPIAKPNDLEVKRIYLLHRFQDLGIGKQLMMEAINYAKQVGCHRLLLGVYEKNKQAITFYERFGFHRIGSRKFHVGNQECNDAIMALDILTHIK
jgi:diamine N-acetyltransferase